jgi:acyl-CoA hydrolase
VFIGGASATPMHLVQAMVDQRHRWTRLEIITPLLQRRLPLFDHAGQPFWFVSTQASPAFKYLWGSGFVGVLPTRYSDHAGLHLPGGPLPVDVALVTVSAPIDDRVSLGLSVGAAVMPACSAPLVIAQVNAEVPYTFGAGELAVDRIDALVTGDEPISDSRASEGDPDPVSARIAELAADLVGDGSTIQFGLGSIPDAILARFRSRRNLRIHSGLVSPACAELHDAGVIEGPMVTGEVISTAAMRDWVHRNPALVMGPPNYTHGAAVLAGLPRFVALNSAVEVALDGSANSEATAGNVISGPGGAPDFAFGASVSNGGRMVLALKSTAAGGTVSRIVRAIEPPNPVTLPAYLADAVITEHGRAEVRGLAGAARAEALRGVAAPHHRDALR